MLLEKNTTNLSLEQFYLSKQDLLSGGYPCKFKINPEHILIERVSLILDIGRDFFDNYDGKLFTLSSEFNLIDYSKLFKVDYRYYSFTQISSDFNSLHENFLKLDFQNEEILTALIDINIVYRKVLQNNPPTTF